MITAKTQKKGNSCQTCPENRDAYLPITQRRMQDNRERREKREKREDREGEDRKREERERGQSEERATEMFGPGNSLSRNNSLWQTHSRLRPDEGGWV